MAMPKDLPFKNAPEIERSMQWALDDLFNNKPPLPEDWARVPRGKATEAFQALKDALPDGVIGIRKVFNSLISTDEHKWLKALRSKPIPPRQGVEVEQTEEQKPKRRIRFVDDDVVENMPAREWLVSGILPRSGVCILFGLPGTYKSFLAIDWALSIGFGRAWLGRKVRKGSVAYIAGEGYAGLGARSKAWKVHNKQSGKSGVKWYGDSVDLTDLSAVNELYEALDEDFAEDPLELIVIDTFSRNSGGAEENSNTDVKKFMHTADLLQKKYNCTVLIIHHSGKNPDKGPRGASAFVGDTETIISVDHFSDALQGIKVACFKQKDAEKFDPIHLTLHKVLYGESPEESSIVLIKTEAAEDENDSLISTKKSVQTMYNALLGKELTCMDWVRLGVAQGISERSAKDARKELYDAGKVWYKKEGKLYYIPVNENSLTESDDSNE